jgi:AraC-like DNA-binding protein
MAHSFRGIDEFPNLVRTSGIEITYCESFDEKSDIWCFDLHNHPSVIEMMFFRSGKASISMSADTYSISYYDLIIYPAGMFHKETLIPSSHQEVICIRIRFKGRQNFNTPIHIKDQDLTLYWLFSRAYAEYKKETPTNLSVDYMRLILLTCYHFCMAEVNDNFIETVVSYIRDHFYEQITLAQIADIVNVSPTHLSRCFKKQTGTSIINYILWLRIDTAKHMLCASNYSVEFIARSTGFSSSKYFNRIFKKYTGHTPSEFRNHAS